MRNTCLLLCQNRSLEKPLVEFLPVDTPIFYFKTWWINIKLCFSYVGHVKSINLLNMNCDEIHTTCTFIFCSLQWMYCIFTLNYVSTVASCDLTIPTCTVETRVRFSVVWTQCVSRRSNESCVHLKCLYKWQGAVRRPTFSFWSPPPCTSGSWSNIPTLRKNGAGPNLIVDVIFLYFRQASKIYLS